ncbi:MAG: hypothetical protein M1822_009461 [Bathelium mastoideum]|nr:MAG: hypothetical protein M1822_009461 [Bathelium mastoideum]
MADADLSIEPSDLAGLPFVKKWDKLKPDFERLYLDEQRKLQDVMDVVKTRLGFDANESQYKYRFFKKWGWKRNVPKTKKKQIVELGQSRALIGKSTTATYKGKPVDPKKLRRQMKDSYRASGSLVFGAQSSTDSHDGQVNLSTILPHKDMIFLKWNLPYESIKSYMLRALDHASPVAGTVATPSDVSVHTPSANSAGSPRDVPSPLTIDLKKKTAIDRAKLFASGHHTELMQGMSRAEQKLAVTWLHQYWYFAFKTAKHWGKGPLVWTPDILGFDQMQRSSPMLPAAVLHSSGWSDETSPASSQPRPPDFCHWSIHVIEPQYDPIHSPPPSERNMDLDDEGTWSNWPAEAMNSSYEKRLVENLETNDFTNLELNKVSLATQHVAQSARQSPEHVLREALGFSIISGNQDLVSTLLEKAFEDEVDVSGIYPLHMAINYLNGAKSCCNIFAELWNHVPDRMKLLGNNEKGHSILDTIMVTILKAHSNCSPGDVDDTLRQDRSFVGEGIDICGRWEPDSECYRILLANGGERIPMSWKHKFCHTSAQVITHCITILTSIDESCVNAPSGLFLKHCFTCGIKMQLFPLHTLVYVAWLITKNGCEDEDFFGILACLLRLLSRGANPLNTAHVSFDALFDLNITSECSHQELTPSDFAALLARNVPVSHLPKIRIGWLVICRILERAENMGQNESREYYHDNARFTEDEVTELDRQGSLVPDVDQSMAGYHCGCFRRCIRPFGKDKYLGHVWAAVQTELLNYRRLNARDPWVSGNFAMVTLLQNLQNDTPLTIGLFREQMIRPHCVCGNFGEPHERDFWNRVYLRDEVSDHYFANMDDWHRSSFISIPPIHLV